MDYIFNDWKALLDNFQQSVEKDLEEIHQQKAEVQQIKTDIFNKIESGLYYHDQKRIVISAPEIIIGHVDKSGTLQGGGMGKVIIKGSEVDLEGVGETGQIVSRAPSIRQLAVDPGTDGLENVVCETSEVISQACAITLHSSDAKDAFSQVPVSAGRGGVSIHADQSLNIEAAVSAEGRKTQIEAMVKELSTQSDDLKKQVAAQKKNVDDCFKKMQKLLDEENKLNQDDAFLGRVSVREISEIHEDMDDVMPALYQSTQNFIHLVSQLAEVNRKKKALEEEKDTITTGDDFKNNTTGASLKMKAENISMETVDGDGNLHTNTEAGITIRTPMIGMSMKDDKGALVENGGLAVYAQNIELNTTNPSEDGTQQPVVGKVNIKSKEINMEAIDYQMDDKNKLIEKELTKDSKITMTAKTIEVATTNPMEIERDDDGKLKKGDYKAEGDVIFKSKVRAEKASFLAVDEEGKATGSFTVNAKAVDVKSMDVDKEKLTDDKLAEGGTMTLVSEKMYVGAKSKDIKSKKFQTVSEEVGLFADKTFEAQQDEGKAVLQLDGGNVSVGGSKTDVFGATTINDKAEVKGELKAPKVSADDIQANSHFKSSNIEDGMAVGGGGGGGSLSAKLKTEDAPKEN